MLDDMQFVFLSVQWLLEKFSCCLQAVTSIQRLNEMGQYWICYSNVSNICTPLSLAITSCTLWHILLCKNDVHFPCGLHDCHSTVSAEATFGEPFSVGLQYDYTRLGPILYYRLWIAIPCWPSKSGRFCLGRQSWPIPEQPLIPHWSVLPCRAETTNQRGPTQNNVPYYMVQFRSIDQWNCTAHAQRYWVWSVQLPEGMQYTRWKRKNSVYKLHLCKRACPPFQHFCPLT